MPSETIVAVFRTAAEAEAVTAELRAAGIHATAIEQHTADQMRHETAVTGTDSGEKRSGFWGWVMGDDASSDDSALYDQKLAAGSVVLSVVVADTDAARVEAIIEKHHPIDIDERDVATPATAQPVMAASVAKPAVATTARATAGTEHGEVIALAEESLNIGKRVIDRGVAKIRRYVVARPVEEQIRLRTESLRMERRPVTGDVKVGADAFSEKTFEMKQTSEEAVVSKTARVVEEVVIGKDVTERVETVKDTVRREEIEVVDAHGKGVAARPGLAPAIAPAKTPVPATQR